MKNSSNVWLTVAAGLELVDVGHAWRQARGVRRAVPGAGAQGSDVVLVLVLLLVVVWLRRRRSAKAAAEAAAKP